MTNPYLIPVPFARDGNKNPINLNPSSSNLRAASWIGGFGLVTMTPEDAGGQAPDGLDFNGIYNAMSQGLVHRQNGSRIQFDTDYCVSIGGYEKGAIIQSNDGLKEFQSLIDNNLTNPNLSLGASWRIYAGDGAIPDASQTVKGVVQFATPTQVSEKQNVNRAITPKNVMDMFVGGFSSMNDGVELPNGLIIKWGHHNPAVNIGSITFKEPFKNNIIFGMCNLAYNQRITTMAYYSPANSDKTKLGFVVTSSDTMDTDKLPFNWFAIGY